MRKEKNIYGFISIEEWRQVLARLQAAAWMGLIDSAGLEAAEERRNRKNSEIEKRLEEGGTVYGLTYYTPAMYLQYELTRLKLAYTVRARGCLEHDTRRSAGNACFGGTDGLHPVNPEAFRKEVEYFQKTGVIPSDIMLDGAFQNLLYLDISLTNEEYPEDVKLYFDFLDQVEMTDEMQEYLSANIIYFSTMMSNQWYRPLFLEFVTKIRDKKYLKTKHALEVLESAFTSWESYMYHDDRHISVLMESY